MELLKIMLTRLGIFNFVITIVGKELFEDNFFFSFQIFSVRSWSTIKTYLTYLKTKEDNA